ncbi:hypothetical protein ES703_33156 [subsurface metagenome]
MSHKKKTLECEDENCYKKTIRDLNPDHSFEYNDYNNNYEKMDFLEQEPADSMMVRSDTEVIRTYKVGLRVPESLLLEQNELIIELEVLSHIRKNLKGKKPSELITGKISKSSREVSRRYREASDKYQFVRTVRQANKEVARVRNAIKQLHRKNSVLNSPQFSSADVSSFQRLDAPQINEISLTDYQNLANESLKMLCKHLNEQVLNEIHKIPRVKQVFLDLAFKNSQSAGKCYTQSQIRSRFEIALANITGIHSNIGRTAFYQLGMAMKGYFDLRNKVEFVRQRIDLSLPSNADFSGELPILLAFYSPPNNLRNYLTRAWGVDSEWVRNTLVGWRRKLDPFLPLEFQIEHLTGIFTQLADSYRRHARDENDVKLISRLQEKHVLHLLPNPDVDLTPLLPWALHVNYQLLRNRISQSLGALTPHIHSISPQEFLQAADELIQDVHQTQSQFGSTSQPYKNCQTFINKINHIKNEANSQEFIEILKNYIIGNRFTRSVAKLLAKGSKYSRLFTAVRGIISLTLAKRYPSAIGQFLSAFTPDACLTFPFTSENRDKSQLPVNLLFNKFIAERKADPTSSEYLVNRSNSSKMSATDIFRNDEPLWLGLPIYSPHQEQHFQELLQGNRERVRRKGLFWFQLIPSKKIVECVRRGAEVRDIRLNVPKGPTNKIVVDIVLSSENLSSFQHGGKFLKTWDDDFGNSKLPRHDILGSDFNRIGKYMVATANPDEEHELKGIMKRYKDAHDKLEKFRKWEIPHAQVQISTGIDQKGNRISAEKKGRLETQVTLLHRRRQRLMKEMKRQALMLYLFVAWKVRAKYLAWDSIGGISTRGHKGALAQAITYLPKRKALYNEFKQWAEDLKQQGFLTHYKDTIPMSPFNSQVCASCFQQSGEAKRTRVNDIPYDAFQCKICGRDTRGDPKINRHSNSARVSALLLQNHLLLTGLLP